MNAKITVKKVFENTSKTSGKQYWTIYDTAGEKYSVWDGGFMPSLQEGMTANVTIEEKGQYKNITEVVPNGDISSVGNLIDDADILGEPSTAPVGNPATKPELPEVKLAVAERISAITAAVALVAADKIPLANLYDHADQILSYYQGVRPTNGREAAKKSGVEEYIK